MAAIAGTVISSLLPFLMDKLFPGKQSEYKSVSNLTPEQEQLMAQIFGGLGGQGGGLQKALANINSSLSGNDKAFEQNAMTDFKQNIIPNISETFTKLGAGAQGSSAFGQQLGAAGSGLAERLALHKQGIQQQGFQDLLSMLQTGMQPSFSRMQIPGSQGFGSQIAPAMGQIATSMAPQAGTEIMDLFKKLFKRTGKGGQLASGQYGMYPTQGNYNMYTDKMGLY
jgi:hypothetical protein